MEQDVRKFLERFSRGELARRGILRGSWCLLQGPSVNLLIELMKEHNVRRLVAGDRRWFLTSDGEFANPRSGQRNIRRGRVSDLINQGDVFTAQNKFINPHFDSYQSPPEDSGDTVQELRRDLAAAQREVARIPGLEADLAAAQKEAGRVAGLEADLEAAQKEVARVAGLEADLEAAQKEAGRVPGLEADLAAAQKEAGRVPGLEADLAAAQKEAGRVPGLEADLAAAQKEAGRVPGLEADLAAAQKEAGRVPGLEADLAAAQKARDRYKNRVREIEKDPTPLTVGDLAEMKNSFRRLANKVEGTEEDIYPAGILNLRNDELIPKLVAQVMLMILQARNNLEHPPHKLSSTQEEAVRGAWEVVKEWASDEGLEAALTV